MSDMGSRKPPQDQSSGSGQSVNFRQPSVADPIASKRVCFYKSGDAQFNGLRMVINNRTFKTFDALLDSLSKKVPLPFGVRNITTPRGVNAIHTLDELEDGKSYICSDRRKVKPINLALASKKPPPWYHARPITARRRALQLARLDPGRPKRKRKQNAMVVRTPKRLTVFRNGDPSAKHTVMLQKRTTPTFESLLYYVSELMQFPVLKLYTPNGGRLDGLPALILCAGRVVAAGREPFKFANYNTQKSTAPNPWLPASRMPSNRKKPVTRKKKSVSSGTKSRNFSASSERYLVNQIQNSIAGSLCDSPSNPTGSVELENGHRLQSVAETEGDTWLEDGGEGVGNSLPLDDDIEKSFRVNQDGSMTVEMKVRLTVKEEETVHWMTTLTRSSVANQLSVASLAESESESLSLQPKDLPPIDTIDRNNSKDDDLFQLGEGIACEEGIEENDSKTQTDVVLPRRAPSPGPRILRQKQASVESIKTVTAEEIQQHMAGSYSHREETENGKVKEEYCMVRQSSTRPVPKPRTVDSMEINNYNINQTFKSNGMAEISQIEDSAEEITETVLHVYEQQTCQDSYHANNEFSVQGVSMYDLHYGRPPTSDTARFPTSHDSETELRRPSTASESINVWRTGNANLPSQKHKVINTLKSPLTKPTEDKESLMSGSGKENFSPIAIQKAERMSSKPHVRKTQSRQSTTPEKRRKESNADVPEKRKKVKTGFSSAASIRKIYGFRPKTVKGLIRKKRQGTGNGSVQTTKSERPRTHIKFNIQNPNTLTAVKEQTVESRSETSYPFKKNVLNDSPSVDGQKKGTLTKSLLEERIDREAQNMSESVPLPALNTYPNVSKEYVEHWLEKAHLSPTLFPEDKTQTVETNLQVELKEGILEVSEINSEEIFAEEEKSQVPSVLPLEIYSAPNGENLTALAQSPPNQKTLSESEPVLHCYGSLENTTNCNGLLTEKTPLLDGTSLNKAPSPTDGKTKSSNQSPLKERSSRNSSVKKTRLVSNTSLERKMSQRKVSVDKSAITSNPPLKNTITSSPVEIAVENIPLSSSLSSSPTLEKTPLPRNRSLKTTALHNNTSLNTTTLPTSPRTKKTSVPSSLSSEKIAAPLDNLLLKRLSPYSQSLELVSPPTTVKLKKKLLTTNNSLDNTADQKTPLPRKKLPTELALKSIKYSNTSSEKTPIPSPSPLNPEHKFQELGDKSKSCSSTPKSSPHNLLFEPCPKIESYIEENNIDELINELDIPEKLKEELAALHVVVRKESKSIVETKEVESSPNEDQNANLTSVLEGEAAMVNESICNDEPSVDVKSIIKRFMNIQQAKEVIESIKQEVKCTELEVSSKETEPTPEMVKDNVKDEELHADDLGSQDVQIYEEQTSQNKSRLIVKEKQSRLVEEQSILIGDETSCLGKQDSTFEEHHSFDIDKDSGNDNVSCEEHTDAAGEANYEDNPVNSKQGEENESGSEEEHINIEPYIEESYTECQESYVEEQLSEEETNYEIELSEEKTNFIMNEVKTAFHSEETPSQSVAERVTLLEKKVAGLDQRRTVIVGTPGIKRLAHIEAPITSEDDDLTNVSQLSNEQAQIDEFMSESLRTTHSAPQSSLAFSYDSNSSSPLDHEGNRVKSLKEMFMAKSVADIQYGHRRPPNPNTSDLSDSRRQTSDSGGHPSQTSPEVTSEDESLLKSIAKGIVRRTIERLYGKKSDDIKDADVERPLSAPKMKLRESVKSIFSPVHMTPTKVMSDLSYFNATNSFESYREPTRCIAFNAQVAPEESVDAGRWLFKENTLIRKSTSEPTTINKATETCAKTEKERGHTEEDVPYSLFSRTSPKIIQSSELEDEMKPVAPKCTYFTLPHGRDSDLYQDEISTASKSAIEDDLTKEKQDKTEEEPKTWVEKHVTLPDFPSTDFKKLDNKVHPLTESPTEGQVVVVEQPGKGQTAINRATQEPDVLDILYVFCGHHCPIL